MRSICSAVFASGSLSHHFADNGRAPEFMHKVYDPFLEQVDRRVVQLWEAGDWKAFIGMLPMYADKCWGEGDMHDTAMLLGMLGWDRYEAPVDVAEIETLRATAWAEGKVGSDCANAEIS